MSQTDDVARVDRAATMLLEHWNALGIGEHENELYFRTSLRRRRKDGTLEELPIALKRLDNAQRYQARTRSRKRALDLGLDLDRDRDLVSELESFEELAFAMRDPNPPHDQFRMSAAELFQEFKAQELVGVYGELDAFTQRCDPRLFELDGEQMWKVIAEVAERGDAIPLMSIGGAAQHSCIILSARQALRSPTAPLPWRSSSTSAPVSSSETGSESCSPDR